MTCPAIDTLPSARVLLVCLKQTLLNLKKVGPESKFNSQSITGLCCNLPVLGGVMVDVEVEGTAKR